MTPHVPTPTRHGRARLAALPDRLRAPPTAQADSPWHLRRTVGAALRAAAAAAALAGLPSLGMAATACEDDGQRSVRGASECLVVHAQGQPAPDGHTVLLVFIHGDNSGGGPSDPYVERGARFAGVGTVVVTLIRPGYFDRRGRTSTGVSRRFTGDGYRPEVVDAVGGADHPQAGCGAAFSQTVDALVQQAHAKMSPKG